MRLDTRSSCGAVARPQNSKPDSTSAWRTDGAAPIQDILQRSTAVVRPGGTLVTIAEPPTTQPEDGRAVFFIVEADRSRLAALAQRLRDGRVTANVAAVRSLADAPAALAPDAPRVAGTTIVRATQGW